MVFYLFLCTDYFMALLLVKVEVMFLFWYIKLLYFCTTVCSHWLYSCRCLCNLEILFGRKTYNHAFVSRCVYIFNEGTICPEIFFCQLEFVMKCKINFSWTPLAAALNKSSFQCLRKIKVYIFALNPFYTVSYLLEKNCSREAAKTEETNKT